MSAFQRSTIAPSCLSACAIERIHIFDEGSSPLAGKLATGGNSTILETDPRRSTSYVNTYLLLPSPFPHHERRRAFRNPLRRDNCVKRANQDMERERVIYTAER